MPKAIIVVGPECSGTRFLTKIFMHCGCVGQDSHGQKHDASPIEGDPVVWRRSVPHDKHAWNVDLDEMRERLFHYGYHDIWVAAISRDERCNALSQIKAHYAGDEEDGRNRVKRAHGWIKEQVDDLLHSHGISTLHVSYEELVRDINGQVNRFVNEIGLQRPAVPVEVKGGNAKYNT